MFSDYEYVFQVEYSTCCQVRGLLDNKGDRFHLKRDVNDKPMYNIDLLEKKVRIVTDRYIDIQEIVSELSKFGKTTVVNCPELDEQDWEITLPLGDIMTTLSTQAWCRAVYYDEWQHRVRIIAKLGERVEEERVLEAFEKTLEKEAWVGQTIKRVKTSGKIYSLGLQGFSNHEKERIEALLMKKNAYIKQYSLYSETNIVSLIINLEKEDQLPIFIDKLNAYIREKLSCEAHEKDKKIYLLLNENKESISESANAFFLNASINALVAAALIIAGPYILLPLTLWGQCVGLLLGGMTAAVMYKTGGVFYRDAWATLKKDTQADMHTLIALGTGSAWLYSMMLVFFPQTFLLAGLQYQFVAINMILMIVNVGRGVKNRLHDHAKKAIQSFTETFVQYQPERSKVLSCVTCRHIDEARKNYYECHYTHIKKGDIILVENGERCPVEGVIISETPTSMVESALSGQTEPVPKRINDSVVSASLNEGPPVLIRASCNGKDARFIKMVNKVNAPKKFNPSISDIIDKIVQHFVPGIVVIAIVSGLAWLALGPPPALAWMLNSMMSVLLCACPCAMLLSGIPVSAGVLQCFKRGIIVNDAAKLKILTEVNTVIWDKTGTLTIPEVKEIHIADSTLWTEAEIMQLASVLERSSGASEHPIAQALIRKGCGEMENVLAIEAERKLNQGVWGMIKHGNAGRLINVVVGTASFLAGRQCMINPELMEKTHHFSQQGMTSTYIAIDGECVGIVGAVHNLKEDAIEAIRRLQAMGIEQHLLTGDTEAAAYDIAKKVGIDSSNVGWGKTEQEKKDYVLHLKSHPNAKKQKRVVAVIGDGTNDGYALKAADVAMGIGDVLEVARNSDFLLKNLNVATAITIARETMNNLRQNIYWALFYNSISVLSAAGVLYPFFGFVLNPVIASLSMSLSSICVLINSNRLTDRIEEQLEVQPLSFMEKCKRLFSFKTLVQTIKIFFEMSEEGNSPVRKPYFRSTISPSEFASPKKTFIPPPALEPEVRTLLDQTLDALPKKKTFSI